MPTYNSENFLNEALESLRVQSFPHWELIVSDDCSTDNTNKIINDFRQSVPQRVCFLKHKLNIGVAGNRNRAIDKVNAKWVAFLDSDDIFLPTHLEDCWNIALNTGSDFVHSGTVYFDSQSGRKLFDIMPSNDAVHDIPLSIFNRSYSIQTSSIMISLTLINQVGLFDKSLVPAEDLDFYFRCVHAGWKISCTGCITSMYRNHPSSISKNSAIMTESLAIIYDKYLEWDQLPEKYRINICAHKWYIAAKIIWRSNPIKALSFLDRSLSIKLQFRPFVLKSICLLRLLWVRILNVFNHRYF